jgi:hypothetical protein
MKKSIYITALIAIISIAFACSNSTPKTNNKDLPAVEIAQVSYTCPMHPEIRSDKPGKCPICGMDLIKVEISKADSTQIK